MLVDVQQAALEETIAALPQLPDAIILLKVHSPWHTTSSILFSFQTNSDVKENQVENPDVFTM